MIQTDHLYFHPKGSFTMLVVFTGKNPTSLFRLSVISSNALIQSRGIKSQMESQNLLKAPAPVWWCYLRVDGVSSLLIWYWPDISLRRCWPGSDRLPLWLSLLLNAASMLGGWSTNTPLLHTKKKTGQKTEYEWAGKQHKYTCLQEIWHIFTI